MKVEYDHCIMFFFTIKMLFKGCYQILKSLCLCYICLTASIRCPYDVQITVSARPPQGDLAIILRIYGHRGNYDFV